MKNKNLLLVVLSIIMMCVLVGCDAEPVNPDADFQGYFTSNNTSGDTEIEKSGDINIFKPDRDSNRYANVEKNPVATIEMENGGIIKLELYPKVAPESVENFIELANNGFYNGLTFHRTIPGFMIQGGDPLGNGTGGPDYSIYGEFSENGFDNTLKHTRGVLSMARGSANNNSAGSQFFIMVVDYPSLDGLYAPFGEVTEGMEVVDEIVNVEVIRRAVDSNVTDLEEYFRQQLECDRPVNPPKIKTITVDTFGVEYEAPTKIQ